tara:strand:+ start:354 stop:1862 length:1509 start_codon:yes stop_codon:yes gene_type:complete
MEARGMPGIVVNTAVRSGPAGTGEVLSAQAFMVGTTERGKASEPTLVRNLTEYKKYFGKYVAGNLHTYAQTYFEEGGVRLYVQRAVADDAVAGSRAYVDSAGSTVATFTAADVGTWAANLDVQILAGDVSGVRVKVLLDDEVVLLTADLATLDNVISTVNVGVPHLVTVAKESGATTLPVATAALAMASGADGTMVTNGSATDNYIEAVAKMGKDLGPGSVSIPGIATAAAYWHALIDHAKTNDRIAICSFTEASSDTAAKTAISGASPAIYSDPDAMYAAFYYPWVKIPDPAAAGLTVTNAPDAYVQAKRSKAANEAGGPWRVGAGHIAEAQFVSGMTTPAATTMDKATGDSLDNARINALRTIDGKVRVYGARSASETENDWRFITSRDTLNHIVFHAEKRLERHTFSTVDSRGALYAKVRSSLIGILEPILKAGGLYEARDSAGVKLDNGYKVTVADSNNPAATLATGQLTADVAVRVSAVGDKITVNITKSNLTAGIL